MQVVIIGGGIAGLAAAYHLQTQGVEFTLLERADVCGGKIVTARTNGFVIEGGPDALLTTKPAALELCHALGLDEQLIPTNNAQRKTYIWRRGALYPIPDGLQLIAPTKFRPFVESPLLSWRAKARMGMEYFIPPRASDRDESVASFVERRMGREALEVLAEPLLSGIYVADPREQSLDSTFPRYREMEQTYGGILRAVHAQRGTVANGKGATRSLFVSLRGGMAQLTESLVAKLDNKAIQTNQHVTRIRQTAGGYTLYLADGIQVQADAVICSTPAAVTAELVNEMDSALSAQLRTLRAVSSATVSLGYKRADVPHPLDGFGFVVPHAEGQSILGCTWCSVKFDFRAPSGFALLRIFIGGAHQEALAEGDDAALIQTATEALRKMLGITAAPVEAKAFRWHKANPQYDVGHAARIDAIEQRAATHPNFYLIGSSYHGVGIPDCVAGAARAVSQLLGQKK